MDAFCGLPNGTCHSPLSVGEPESSLSCHVLQVIQDRDTAVFPSPKMRPVEAAGPKLSQVTMLETHKKGVRH